MNLSLFFHRIFFPFFFQGGDDNKRANRQLKDAEFGNKDIGNLQELMDVLPNIDVSGTIHILRNHF